MWIKPERQDNDKRISIPSQNARHQWRPEEKISIGLITNGID